MATDDFFRARLDGMVDPRHPLVVLATRLPWTAIEASLAPLLARKPSSRTEVADQDLFGPTLVLARAQPSNAGRPRLPTRLMVALLYLKHSFNLSDEELCERWSENVVWQFFSGMTYYEPRWPCDPTHIGRFRRLLGEAGVEQLLKTTIEAAVALKAVRKDEFERVIVDSTVQEKAIAHPTDSRLLEVARAKLVRVARSLGLKLKQTHEREGKTLRRRAGGYAHAKQFRRLKRVLRRQRTILGCVLRELRRKMAGLEQAAQERLDPWLERAERIHTQRPQDKNKLYALHAPEVECIGKGKARRPYEFGVKTSLAVTHRSGLMVGARSFPGNPYDGHTLAAQIEQTHALTQDLNVQVKTVVVDLGYRGVDAELPGIELLHRGKTKSLTPKQRGWLKRRQAIEPAIGHLKQDHGLQRCWLKGSEGDALHAVLCAAGYNLRWLLRAIAQMGLRAVFFALLARSVHRASALWAALRAAGGLSTQKPQWNAPAQALAAALG